MVPKEENMKRVYVPTLVIAVALYGTVAFAQHGHGGGSAGNGMGHTNMGHDTMGHDTVNHSGTGTGSLHGQSVDQLLSKNTKLSGKIQSLTGMSAQQACDEFKNLGQCVAAAHVSKN